MSKSVLTSKNEGFKLKDYITLSFSIIAIGVSLTNFYFQYFREIHLLKVTATATVAGPTVKDGSRIAVRGIIANYGNKPEAILNGRLEFGDNPTYILASTINPMVLKPGEISTFTITDSIKMSWEEMEKGKGLDSDTYYLNPRLVLSVISTEGVEIGSSYELEHFKYNNLSQTDWEGLEADSLLKKHKWKTVLQ